MRNRHRNVTRVLRCDVEELGSDAPSDSPIPSSFPTDTMSDSRTPSGSRKPKLPDPPMFSDLFSTGLTMPVLALFSEAHSAFAIMQAIDHAVDAVLGRDAKLRSLMHLYSIEVDAVVDAVSLRLAKLVSKGKNTPTRSAFRRMVSQVVFDLVRAARKFASRVQSMGDAVFDAVDSHTVTPLANLLSNEIRDAIASLTNPRQQVAIHMLAQGASTTEIAAALGISATATRKFIQRARGSFRKVLARKGIEDR